MMKTSSVSFGIKGEPSKGIIFQDQDAGIKLTYDPNWQVVSFWDEEGVLYDHLDCAKFDEWKGICCELKTEYGIDMSL